MIRRYRALVLCALAVVVIHEMLNRRNFNPRNHDDAKLLFGVGVIIAISVVIMLVETRVWNLRKTGVFGMILFDALLDGLLLGAGTLWHIHLGQSEQNWLRALLIVCAPLLLVSQVRHIAGGVRAWRTRRVLKRRTA